MADETVPRYLDLRQKILQTESLRALGGSLALNNKESLVNDHILKLKRSEIVAGELNSCNVLPRLHFIDSRSRIERSAVFERIQKCPKGASLHTHLTAAISFNYLYKRILEVDHLYANHINGQFKLRFLGPEDPAISAGWKPLKELLANGTFDEVYLRSQLTLEVPNPREVYPTIEVIWKKFMGMFSATYDMYGYRPFFEEVVYKILEELLEDNVVYAEFRAAVLTMYDLDGTRYPPSEFCRVLNNTIAKFRKENPKFLGVGIILAPSRRMNDESMEEAIEVFKDLRRQFPNLIVGFDLIGFEQMGRPLIELQPILEPLKASTKFFFHAGETNWYGTDTDLNLLDAVLLESSRIGHAFSLVKHPEILRHVKLQNIAIEVTPISNQVLLLVEDLRNHPAASLMAQGLPVVICNDDPTFWGASGLSYDWYLAFMGMSSKDAGLRFLKQLAINSINYSAMKDSDKKDALALWEQNWNEFIDNYLLALN